MKSMEINVKSFMLSQLSPSTLGLRRGTHHNLLFACLLVCKWRLIDQSFVEVLKCPVVKVQGGRLCSDACSVSVTEVMRVHTPVTAIWP